MFRVIIVLFRYVDCLSHLRQLTAQVNSEPNLTWEAGINPRFEQMTEADFKVLLGAKPSFSVPSSKTIFHNDATSIPESFDPRDIWPTCETIGHVYDQGHCGSCWAMCSFAVLQDRFCIASNSTERPRLSAQDVTSCDKGSGGCDGGWATTAFKYFHDHGAALDECIPYVMGRCQHPGCSLWPTPKCVTTCSVPILTNVTRTRYYSSLSYTVHSTGTDGIQNLQQELMKNGPVTAVFHAYADLAVYKRGVYQHIAGQSYGLHAVKLIGWGVWTVGEAEKDDFTTSSINKRLKEWEEELKTREDADPNQKFAILQQSHTATSNSRSQFSPLSATRSSSTPVPVGKPGDRIPYWIIVNSWGDDFGMDGLLLMRRGNNECGIEGTIIAATPVLNSEAHTRQRDLRNGS